MAKPDLTSERLRELLNYDPLTGVFTWRVSPSNRALVGSVAGTLNKRFGYTYISINSKLHKACRLAWLWVYGVWPLANIDHINGARADDRISNLRDVSHSVNMQNIRCARVDNDSGLLGVSKLHNRRLSKPWFARIHFDGKVKHLGCFATGEEAHQAYLVAKRKMHEGCTI